MTASLELPCTPGTTPQCAESGADGAKPQRVALFDNVKGMLMILVVFGHIMHPVHNSNPALSTCFDLIYLFHMPLFVLMSGLFAKGAYRGGKLNINRIVSFVMLGFAYQLVLALINGAALTPQRICAFTSAPWYLISMAWWYLCTPILARLGAARGMVLSLAISLLWGLVDMSDGFLAISRTYAFLPWFAAGYYLTSDALRRARESRWAVVAVVAAIGIMAVRVLDAHTYDWFFQMVYGDNPYLLDGLTAGEILASSPVDAAFPQFSRLFALGVAQRLTALGVAGTLSLAILRLAPAGRSWLTTLGRRTLQVYVMHRLIRAWLTFHTPLYDFPVMNDPVLGTAIVAAISVTVIALCTIPQLEKPFARFLKIRWLPQAQ